MSTRTELLKSLDGPAGLVLSGEALAQELGISRAGVWKQLQGVIHAGLPLEGSSRQGYKLKAPFDSSLAAYRAGGWGTPHYYLTASSTQTLAKGGAAAGLPEGHLWIAEIQSKGRGRLDRKWESAYGGLWFSLLLRPRIPAAGVAPLTLIAGMALRDAVEKVCGIKATLKWPNDLLVSGQKVAGILTEMSGQIDRTEWVLLGVGLNVNNTLPAGLTKQANSLYRLSGRSWARGEFLNVFLQTFKPMYARYLKDGFERFRKPYWSRYFAPGKITRLTTANGPVTGHARGVDASGALLIESRRKTHAISEGEIIL